jgi:hypothetical protein
MDFVAQKLNPVGLHGSASKVGVDLRRRPDVVVTDVEGSPLTPTKSVVWLTPGARITVGDGRTATDLEWN